MARQGYANAVFDRDEGEEGLDVVEEFYRNDTMDVKPNMNQEYKLAQNIQKELHGSVMTLN